MRTDARTAADWLDAFFDAYYARHPVNATFIGVHEYDDRLPDYSDAGTGDTLSEMRELLRASESIDATALTPVEAVDLQLARGELRTQIREFESLHFQRGNPSLYIGEAVFGAISLFLTDYAPLQERVDAATRRLAAVPKLLSQAKANVRAAPAAWTERALRECRGALAFLSDGVARLDLDGISGGRAFQATTGVAAAAIDDFDHWLGSELLHRTDARAGCGEAMFASYLHDGHHIDRDAEEVLEYARTELERAERDLHEASVRAGARDPQAALDRLRDVHPPVEAYYERYQEIWDAMRDVALAHDVVTWPELPIRFVPRPAWARSAAPDLYFLFYRSPAVYARPPIHELLVTPIDAAMSPAERDALLRANHDAVIKLNHVVHHGGVGHHVQNAHAFRSPSRIGRVAAVDCASRIAMFCGGTMAEGWACYATGLMAELGALTPLETIAELHARVRMCVRAIVDVLLHHGRITLEQAAAWFVERAGMAREQARAEAVKISMFPATALMYLVGTDAIRELRRDLSARLGPEFRLRDFHDRLLAWGSVPVSLVAAEMSRETQPAA